MSTQLESPSRAPRRHPLRRSVGAAAAIAEGLLERREPALARRLSARERRTELVVATLFALVAAGLPLLHPESFESPRTAVLLVACYGLVRRVRFPLGPGLIRPTQLVFVPMLLLTPAAGCRARGCGSALGELPELLLRRAHPERLAVVVADGWYSVGPALVVTFLGPGHGRRRAAARARRAVRHRPRGLERRASVSAPGSPPPTLPVLALVFLIDALLAPVGYLAVLASANHEYAYLLAIAPARCSA